ncbi:MAG: sulfotransferase family protein [Solirubrobacteraceae bacterium]
MAGANPYLFVVGAARSGTTLLQRMLDAHPELAVVNETYWVPRKFRERLGLTRQGLVTDALVPMLLASPKFERMGVSEDDLRRLLSSKEPLSYDGLVASIFDLYADRAGKPLAGDKTPGYVRRIGQIHELLPRARFVHIIRDPRDVCLSMRDWSSGERTAGQYGTWQLDPVVSTALYWRYSVTVGREAGAALGPELYHEVRYEDLVADPEKELWALCGFLALPYAEQMTRYHEGKTRVKPGRSSKAQWLPPTAGLRDWRSQLGGEEVQRIEIAVDQVLLDLGYEPGQTVRTDAARDHVALVHEAFTAGALARERVLPGGWQTW